VLVVIGHVYETGERFSKPAAPSFAYRYLASHAHAAVIVFFVLSGYVMAFATTRKRAQGSYGLREYFLDRWSRIYSVLGAAIVWTLVIDYFGGLLFPTYAAYGPKGHFAIRLLANIACLQGTWGRRMELGTNGALWSIGYEWLFYFVYGVVVFRSAFRSKSTPLILAMGYFAISGLTKSAYMFVWLLGVVAFHLSQRTGARLRSPVYAAGVLGLLLANHLIEYRRLASSELVNDVLFGAAVATFLVFEIKAGRRAWHHRLIDVNARMAGFSYTLYAFHLPLVFFVQSMVLSYYPQYLCRPEVGIAITVLCVAAAQVVFYPLGEERRRSYRRGMQQLLEAVFAKPRAADLG
jgi:peptidoglycan/LPS O-acetylase OafA/YrhL